MRVWRPQPEIAPFQAGGETQWYDFNFNAIALNWPMAGVDSNEVVFGMDAKASPHGWVNGDLSAVNPSHG